jgi:hypothetical protein
VYGWKDEAEVTQRSAGEIQGVGGVKRRPSERDDARHRWLEDRDHKEEARTVELGEQQKARRDRRCL